jgi:hypothetical protein
MVILSSGDIRMKKAVLILNFVMLLVSSHVYANDFSVNKPFSLSDAMSIKLENGLGEAKDAAPRKGTENWEESQASFFIAPGIAIGIVALFFIFNRNKD